jgi:hypothetical protein
MKAKLSVLIGILVLLFACSMRRDAQGAYYFCIRHVTIKNSYL